MLLGGPPRRQRAAGDGHGSRDSGGHQALAGGADALLRTDFARSSVEGDSTGETLPIQYQSTIVNCPAPILVSCWLVFA